MEFVMMTLTQLVVIMMGKIAVDVKSIPMFALNVYATRMTQIQQHVKVIQTLLVMEYVMMKL